MKRAVFLCVLATKLLSAAAVQSYEGTLSIPTYEHTGREMQPPLFANSSVTGMYPFTTYLAPFKPGPVAQVYRAVFVENEYLKLTYIPDFGDRIFSVYDKLRGREMLYRNDVIKPAPYNPRNSWPQSGMELTGPHDLHTLTLHGEPYWAHKVVRHEDGSISLVLGEIDPVYGMKVNFSATLHPGVAALEIGVFCFNERDGRKPQMFWVNTAIAATPKTRFLYPMSRTVGHTTAEIADWPLYNGIDYSWDRNNKHMLGVFGIDIYDNFQGAYQFDRDYGVFRYGDRRVVQGMKLWTFGYGNEAKNYENGYTDHAGPYVELQSGRHVWDGHYEWVAPHTVEGWSEWWVPVSQTGGLTTLTRDIALNLDVQTGEGGASPVIKVALGAIRIVQGARLSVEAKCGRLLDRSLDLDPARPFSTEVRATHANAEGLQQLTVKVTDKAGHVLLAYVRPDENAGRKEYTPFTRPLEQPRKSPEAMGVEELTLAAEYRLKELDEPGAIALLEQALRRDAGYSRAHLLWGITDFNDGRYREAEEHLKKVIERDPYDDAGYFYLSMTQFALDEEQQAVRNLYYIWPESSYYGEREYHLGLVAFKKGECSDAIAHFRQAIGANGQDLLARLALVVALRKSGRKDEALREASAVEAMDPTSRPAAAERWFVRDDAAARAELLRLTGGQTQEAIAITLFYRTLGLWGDATRILKVVGENNHDPWGVTPVFYYTLAYCQRRAGDAGDAERSLAAARAAAGKVDRFPYREETEAPLAEAIRLHPDDLTARFDLACLLYFRGHPREAIEQWEAVLRADPQNFASHRALGLAYAEQGRPLNEAVAQLEHAVRDNPDHVRTLDDLSAMYARAGRFEDQLALLEKSFDRSPSDDDLAEGLLAADLSMGHYSDAEHLIATHAFATRHRSYDLRDKYRLLRSGMGAKAFRAGDYARALELFESALRPPTSLGVDTFENQASPRLDFYIGRSLEALGRTKEARAAYERSIAGIEQLSGDRDSWSSENYFMVLALDRLGRVQEANRLEQHFANFAETERDDRAASRRAAALYLLALIQQREHDPKQARDLLNRALDAQPDLLAARLAIRGDVIDPLG